MAENRKTKPNYKDVLAEKAKAMAPSAPAPEQVEVEVDGVVVPVARGDMDDATWERVKQRAVKFETPEKHSGDKIIVKTPSGKMTIVRDNQTDAEWADVTLNTKKQYGIKNIEEHYTPPEERGRGEQWGEGTIFKTKEEFEKAKSMPSGPEKTKYLKSLTDRQAERAEEVSSAGVSGSSPMARVASMVQQAATGATPEENKKYVEEYQTSRMEVPQEAKQVVDTMRSVGESVGPMAIAKRIDDTLTDGMSGLNQAVVGAAKSVNDALTPQPTPNEQQMAAREDAGLDPLTAEPAVAPPQVPPPAQQPPMDGSASMSASVTPGVAAPDVPMHSGDMSKWREAADATKQRLADLEETRAAAEIIQDGVTRESNKRRLETAKQMEQDAALAKQARINGIEEARRYQTARTAVMEKVREAASSPIDPNRYWNNKTDGQKAMSILAGALFGYAGQGMQWLQRIDGLIEADNRLQAADRDSKVRGLQAEAQMLGEAGREAMARGATEAEAHLIDKQAKYEGLQVFLQGMAEQSQNLDRKVKYGEMAAQMGMRAAQLEQEGAQLSEMRAHNRNMEMLKKAELGMEASKANATLALKSAGPGMKFSPGEVGRMNAARQGLEAVKSLRQLLGPESSLPQAMYDEVTKRGGQLTEAGRRQKSVEPLRRAIIRLIDASAIQKADAEFWKDKISNVGMDNMSQSDLDGLVKFFTSQNNAIVDTRAQMGERLSDGPEFPEEVVE